MSDCEKSPLLVAHERVAARADEFLAAADAADLSKGVDGDGLRVTLEAFGLDWPETERFCNDAVDSILDAIRGGANPETAIGSIVITALLTGIALAESREKS